jgi:hypothetical protein
MIRKKLAQDEGERKKFRAVFSRFGKKINFNGYSETTLLLTQVVDIQKMQVVADHVWFSLTKGFEAIKLEEGTIVEFEARVKEYSKGYVNKRYGINNRRQDFKLSHPGKIVVIDE